MGWRGLLPITTGMLTAPPEEQTIIRVVVGNTVFRDQETAAQRFIKASYANSRLRDVPAYTEFPLENE